MVNALHLPPDFLIIALRDTMCKFPPFIHVPDCQVETALNIVPAKISRTKKTKKL